MKEVVSILLVLVFGVMEAQTITLSGTVVNERNKPIENVNVYLEGSYEGALSDSKGYFTFTVKDTLVNDVLKFIHPQYTAVQVDLRTSDDYTDRFVMQKKEDQLEEIVIHAKSKLTRERAEQIGFSAMDVVSTAGSPGNIIGLVGTMPGAQVNGEDGRLLIRGGRAEESGIYVNGIKVFQPYTASIGNMPVRSKFNPFLFKGMSFSAGGYSAEFGDALSGVLQLDTSDDIDPSRKDFSISTVGVSLGQTHQWGRNSLSYSLNYQNLGPYTAVVKQRYHAKKPFSAVSTEFVYKRKVKEGGYKLYGAIDFSTMAIEQELFPRRSVDTLALKSHNVYLNSLYFKKLSPYMRLDIGTGIGYAYYKGDRNQLQTGTDNLDVSQKVKLSYQWNSKWYSIVGGDVQTSHLNFTRSIGKYGVHQEANELKLSLFFENNWNILSRLSLRAGIRASKYSTISDWKIAPRTMLTYQLDGRNQVSLSYGVFNQRVDLAQGIYLKKEDLTQAEHYIFNYTYTFKKRMLRTEVFYKDYSKLLLTPKEQLSNYAQRGKGYAKGIDVFWKDGNTFRNLSYWITYTYLDSKRKELYWNEWIQPSYVAQHNFSLVTKYWLGQWKSQVSMTYGYTSPRDFYNTDTTDAIRYKSSPIHNVSLSWSYLLSAQKIVYASVDNLLGRDPVYAYQFTQQKGPPDIVNASAKRFIYIGFMWTISSDKKSNQLDNL